MPLFDEHTIYNTRHGKAGAHTDVHEALKKIMAAGLDIRIVPGHGEEESDQLLRVTIPDGNEGHWMGILFNLNKRGNNRVIGSRE